MDVHAMKRGEFDTINFLYFWQRGNSGEFWDDLHENDPDDYLSWFL
ncbi:uncharacterized protein involved in tellurium resistance [Methanofollis sp. W23]|nr:uncharacterized protein involved in tellurium resistance [Methanofollis sp. W23]